MKFSISRYDPDRDAKPYLQDYEIELLPTEHMLLDVMLRLKQQDPTLTLRKSCREGVCGSDAMNINGRNGLACITRVRDLSEPVVIRPLPGFPIIRDLFVDMTQFFKQYHSITPYLVNDEPPPEKERLQSPAERERLNGSYECILCACCSSQCPSYWWNPDKFVGPAGLIQAYRFIVDSRDRATQERLDDLERPLPALPLPHDHELRRGLPEGARAGARHRENPAEDVWSERQGWCLGYTSAAFAEIGRGRASERLGSLCPMAFGRRSPGK